MVVVRKPAVKGCGAFAAGAVERAVGPAAEQGADEAFGFAVGARPVGPGAQVADAERAAGEGVDRRAITGAVVGHHGLDGDAVAGVERDRALQESDGRGRLLIGEDLDVGQPGRVIDADMHEFPADLSAAVFAVAALQPAVAVYAMAGAALWDPAELLDVDVQQLARVPALVAVRRLGRLESAELAQADSEQDR